MSNKLIVWVSSITFNPDNVPVLHIADGSPCPTSSCTCLAPLPHNTVDGFALVTIEDSDDFLPLVKEFTPLKFNYSMAYAENILTVMGNTPPELVCDFIRLCSMLEIESAQILISSLLRNRALLHHYFHAPGSFNQHHAYPHGLFAHSIDVAKRANFEAHESHICEDNCQLLLASALLHDLGKVSLCDNNDPVDYRPGPHQGLTFALLAEPISRIKAINQKHFDLLNHLFDPSTVKGAPYFLEQGILSSCDAMSAMTDDFQRAFADCPSYYHYTNFRGRTFKR